MTRGGLEDGAVAVLMTELAMLPASRRDSTKDVTIQTLCELMPVRVLNMSTKHQRPSTGLTTRRKHQNHQCGGHASNTGAGCASGAQLRCIRDVLFCLDKNRIFHVYNTSTKYEVPESHGTERE